MCATTEQIPAVVSSATTQAGEVRARWAWAEPSVWTERMLTALEEGVKGGKWFSLIDKVHSPENLRASFARVKSRKGSAGVDHQTIAMFERRLETNLAELGESLRTGTYRPQAIRRTWIPKPGRKEKRPLGIPTVRDRVVQGAVRNALEPIFERDFAETSFGFRPGRGCKDALRRVNTLLNAGHVHVVDADLQSYFDTIPHEALMARIERKVSDGRVLGLLRQFLGQEVLDTLASWTPKEGTPQGAVISPLLSNLYLDPLDHLVAASGLEMARYADDFVILCRSEAEASRALGLIHEWTEANGLRLHPDKTRVTNASERGGGFDFLGYHFERGRRRPSRKSQRKLKDAVGAKTKRTNGHSLDVIIRDVNRTTRGWFDYFKHSRPEPFGDLDGWIRMRLRSLLRKRMKKRGRGRGSDHQRWPNAYFAKHGLFSLATARATASQSAVR